MFLSVYAETHAECRYDECRYGQCHGANIRARAIFNRFCIKLLQSRCYSFRFCLGLRHFLRKHHRKKVLQLGLYYKRFTAVIVAVSE